MSKDNEVENRWEQTEPWYNLKLRTLVDYPDDTIRYGRHFQEFPVTAKIFKGSTIRITICDVFESYEFWFLTSKMRHSFYKLNNEMKLLYDMMYPSKLALSSSHIFPGQICAVPTGKTWSRGIIVEYLMGKSIKVFLVDVGIQISIAPSLLKYLLERFITLPMQAIRGSLVNVTVSTENCKKRRKFFSKIARGHEFLSNVVHIQELNKKPIVHLEISEINKLLVEKDCWPDVTNM